MESTVVYSSIQLQPAKSVCFAEQEDKLHH